MLRSLSAMAAGVMIVALPVVAMAEKPAHAGQNGKAAAKVERKLLHKPNPGQTRAARDAGRPFVHLEPRLAQRCVGFAGDECPHAAPGVVVHGFRELAQDSPSGLGPCGG